MLKLTKFTRLDAKTAQPGYAMITPFKGRNYSVMKLLSKSLFAVLLTVFLCAGTSIPDVSASSSPEPENTGGSIKNCKIVYLLKPGDPGYSQTVPHGLIAANRDLSGTFDWKEAKAACERLDDNGFKDWHLPNRDELNKLFLKKNVIGGFTDTDYWSSSVYDIQNAYSQHFFDGYNDFTSTRDRLRVRAVRVF